MKTTCLVVSRAPGVRLRGIYFLALFFFPILFFKSLAFAAEGTNLKVDSVDSPVKPLDSFVLSRPFVPLSRDYGIEVGSMWEKSNLFWLAGTVGFHMGTCIFSSSQSCQQYIDVTSGAGTRDAETLGLLFGSARWQFVNFPDPWSPLVRVFAGSSIWSRFGKIQHNGIAGFGFGTKAFLHDRVDLRLESRFGVGRHAFSQVFFSFEIKIDRWVEYFAKKVKDLGEGTIDVTGNVIDATGDVLEVTGKGLKEAGETVVSPFVDKKGPKTPPKPKKK